MSFRFDTARFWNTCKAAPPPAAGALGKRALLFVAEICPDLWATFGAT